MSKARAMILRNQVKKAVIRKKRFTLFTRPILTLCVVIIPIFLLAAFIDAFIPFMPEVVSYAGIVLTFIVATIGYIDVIITNKVRDAKMNYRRYISRA